MFHVATQADKIAIETAAPIGSRWQARTLYALLSETAERSPNRPAITFQITSGPRDRAETLTWRQLKGRVTQAANLFRRIGIGDRDVIAFVLPNCNEAAITLLAGATAGVVNPINPMLDAGQIAAILRETGAKAVVTLAPFPKTDLSAKVARAVAQAPGVRTIVEVDLARYLRRPARWAMPFVRPRLVRGHGANILRLRASMAGERSGALNFEETGDDRICAAFHTGGTTGLPKIALHRHSGIIYNGWCGAAYIFGETDVLICPLPMFHVLATYPVFMSCVFTGARLVLPTPAGYRGEGVFGNFWKLVERYRVTFIVMVPSAAGRLMRRKIDADVSSLHSALCGSAPLPVALFRRFQDATGVKIFEGYGMTEATCLISINPPFGERKIGSVGFPFPYTDVRICHCDDTGAILRDCEVDEIGEICVAGPGVIVGGTYLEAEKNIGLYAGGTHLRTGDLGRIDADGYIWITGRAKDVIIRAGHNIDPARIEDALMSHPGVALAGVVGQPDRLGGEAVAAYVEPTPGRKPTVEELAVHARESIGERAAQPRHIEIMDELPKTAVGKVFKPDLRRMAISRVYGEALTKAGLPVEVSLVYEDRRRGLVAALKPTTHEEEVTDSAVQTALDGFAQPWEWQRKTGDG